MILCGSFFGCRRRCSIIRGRCLRKGGSASCLWGLFAGIRCRAIDFLRGWCGCYRGRLDRRQVAGRGGWWRGGAYILEHNVASGWISGHCNCFIVGIKLLGEISRGVTQLCRVAVVVVDLGLSERFVLADGSCIDHSVF